MIFLLAVLVNVLAGLPVFLVAALFPQITAQVPAVDGAVGICVAAFWVAAALSSNGAGWLTARIGVRNSLHTTLGLAGVSLLGTVAMSPRWEFLPLWLAVGGVATGLCHPATNQLLVRLVKPDAQAVAFGIKQSALPMSTLVSGFAIPVVALTVGWQWAYVTAVLVTAMAFVSLFIAMDAGEDRRAAGSKRTAHSSPPQLSAGAKVYYRWLGSATSLASGASMIVSSYAVVNAPDGVVSHASAGTMLGIASAVAIVARIGLGWWAGATGARPLRIVVALLLVGLLGALLLTVGSAMLYMTGLVFALGFGWAWPGLVHYTVSRTAKESTPRATGMVQTGTYIGCCSGPLVGSAVMMFASSAAVWALAALLFMCAAAAVWFVTARREPMMS